MLQTLAKLEQQFAKYAGHIINECICMHQRARAHYRCIVRFPTHSVITDIFKSASEKSASLRKNASLKVLRFSERATGARFFQDSDSFVKLSSSPLLGLGRRWQSISAWYHGPRAQRATGCCARVTRTDILRNTAYLESNHYGNVSVT